jgi:hypothetical protein
MLLKVARPRPARGMMQELAYWDQRHVAVRVPVVIDAEHTVPCLVTLPAVERLAGKQHVEVRECFRVVRSHSEWLARIVREKFAEGRRREIFIDPGDLT